MRCDRPCVPEHGHPADPDHSGDRLYRMPSRIGLLPCHLQLARRDAARSPRAHRLRRLTQLTDEMPAATAGCGTRFRNNRGSGSALRGVSAIDGERLTGDERGIVRQKVNDPSGVPRAAVTPPLYPAAMARESVGTWFGRPAQGSISSDRENRHSQPLNRALAAGGWPG